MATVPQEVPNHLASQLITPSVVTELAAQFSAGAVPLEPPSKLVPCLPTVGEERRYRQKRRSHRGVHISLVAADLVLCAANGLFVFWTRFGFDWRTQLDPPVLVHQYVALFVLYCAVTLLCCQNYGLYRFRRSRPIKEELLASCKAVLGATALLATFVVLGHVENFSRLVIVSTGLLNLISFSAWRYWGSQNLERRVSAGKGERNAVIVGANRMGYELAKCLERNRHLGYVVRGFVDDTAHSNGFKVLGRTDELLKVVRAEYVDEVFLAPPYSPELLSRIAAEAEGNRVEIKIVPAFLETLPADARLDYIGDLPVLSIWRKPIPASSLFVKRVLDVVLSIIALFITAPLLAALALAIKLDSPGPALYTAERIGRKGQRFRCYKLRTMVINADQFKEQLRAANERRGAFFKLERDPRITRLGRLLRKYSLDELPQVWNVLKGQMSLVGPRPHPVDDFANYTLEDRRRLEVRPGITGLWQIMGRRDPSFERNMAFDLQYIESWSLALDFKILLKTFPAVLKGTGQ